MSVVQEFGDTYEVIGEIGHGAGGIVYKAYHKRLRQEVVLKKIRRSGVSEKIGRKEADILKKLHNSYLPQVLDFLTAGDGSIYTVMSFVPGKTLKELMEQGVVFSRSQLVHCGMQLCSALHYLHSQNPPVIHGDIKPSNIMLTPEGNICLIDFNIAFYLDAETILGCTEGYTSPEQYRYISVRKSGSSSYALPPQERIDQKTDIYSLGATFYHLVIGKKIVDYRKPIDRKLLEERAGTALAHVIEKAVEIRPERRFSNAMEMFHAFQNVPKQDGRYKRLIRNQRIQTVLWITGLCGCIALGGYGVYTLNRERTEQYNMIVEEQIACRESGDFTGAEERYQEAAALIPSALETYYQNAYNLYEQREYSKCIDFIDYDILQNEKIDKNQERMAGVWQMKADSHFQMQEYQEAVTAYEEGLKKGIFDSSYYRDYAIALAYSGSEQKAGDVLQEAIDGGLEEDSVYYAKGEIDKALEKYDEAAGEFQQCIGITQDNELKARAYVMLSEIYELQGKKEDNQKILKEAQGILPVENQMLILERLVQADIDLADMSGDSAYREDAVETLHQIIAQNWESYDTYDNLAILNEKLGNLDEVENVLIEMQSLYGEDYNILKRYAFLEIDRQEKLENENRDYTKFAEYYRKASQMYEEQLQNNQTDPEMELLDHVYQQVQAGGWL